MADFFRRAGINPNLPGGQNPVRLAVGLFGAGLLTYGVMNSFYQVPAGHRAVVFNRIVGVKEEVSLEGLNFIVPWLEKPTIICIRAFPKLYATDTPSKDLQSVQLKLRVLMKPDSRNLPKLFSQIGTDYEDKVMVSIVNETMKSVVAQFNASQLVTMREQVSSIVKERLIDRAKDFFVLLDDVSITDLTFTAEYTQAVESKQVAQQDAERAKFIVERAKQQKLEIIVRADADARAAKLFNEQMKADPEGAFIQLKRVEVAKDIARALAQSPNKAYLNSDLLMLDLFNPRSSDEAFSQFVERGTKALKRV